MNTSSRKLGKMLQKRYITALCIIAFLVIFSQSMIQYTIIRQEDDSRIVNIAGRQRMLSQRINKAAFGLYIDTSEGDRERYSSELALSLELWDKSHKGLQYGDAELGLPGHNSKIITAMFASIDVEFNNIINAARNILETASETGYDKARLLDQIQIIQNNEQQFLKGMDEIVFQYDFESKQKVELIKYTEIIILVVTFFTLGMEILFIFRPAQKQIEKSLEEAETNRASMESLFETAPSAMLLLDEANLRVMKLNHLAQEVLSLSSSELSDLHLKQMLDLGTDKIDEVLSQLTSGKAIENLEVVINTADQQNLVMLLSSNLIKYNDKRTILLGLSDITRLKQAEEVLRRYATLDEMTGLLNKRSGILVLGNILEHARANHYEICVCFIDVDGLKAVNDTYGHEEGDAYIISVANAVRHSIDACDPVFRYGGDEIVAVLVKCDLANAEKAIRRIKENLKIISVSSGKPYQMRFSYGLASSTDMSADTPEKLLTIADKEMYLDKKRNSL